MALIICFLGSQKRVWNSHGKRVVGILVIEVLLYACDRAEPQ